MDLQDFRTKPHWEDYEASLLDRGYLPYWDPEVQEKLSGITCCSCGRAPSYVGMTNDTTALGFLACDPDCGGWMWWLAPTTSTRP